MIRFLRVLIFFALLIVFPVGLLALLWCWLQQQNAYTPTLMGKLETVLEPAPSTAIEIPEEALKSSPPDIEPPAGVMTIAEAMEAAAELATDAATDAVSFGVASMEEEATSSISGAVESEDEDIIPDELNRIEGIGPKVTSLLQAAGILTFAQLAETEVAQLKSILADASLQFMKPDAWPEQAAFAAAEDWDRLAALQDELKGGRRA